MDSFYNFMWDCFIKSFENKDALLEATSSFSEQEKQRGILNYFSDIDSWKKIYDNRFDYLSKHVRLCFNGSYFTIDNISFHPKYGWIVYSGDYKAYLGKSSIYESVRIDVGHRSYFSGHSTIRGNGLLKIGSYCSIAFGLYLNVVNENHPINYPASIGLASESRMVDDGFTLPLYNKIEKKNPNNFIEIGNDVWIGRDVTVFNRIKLGHGCVIGARSLVTKNCEPFGIYAGIPAKLIRYRFPDNIIEQLLEIKWWDWPEEKILRNKKFFDTDLTKFKGQVITLIEN